MARVIEHYHRELQADLLLKLLCIQKMARFSLLKATLSNGVAEAAESKWLRLDLSRLVRRARVALSAAAKPRYRNCSSTR